MNGDSGWDAQGRLVAGVRAADPGWVALRRAGRLTIASCAGFFACRYGLGNTTAAVYAVFTVIALGALSQVSGFPDERTRIYVAAFLAGAVLLTVGTFAAVSTVTAVAGMLVVGFAVAYAGVGGPVLVGLTNGLQLLYILPCFPPYAPQTLPARLFGLAVGTTLLVVADRLLWPPPAPVSFAARVAEMAELVRRYLHAVRADLLTAGDGSAAALREEVEDAAQRLRLYLLPPEQRPAGPGLRDRGLTQAAGSLRVIAARSTAAADLLAASPTADIRAPTAGLFAVVEETLGVVATALREAGPPPEAGPLDTALAGYRDRRAAHLTARTGRVALDASMRAGVAVAAVAEAARLLVAATRAAVGAPRDPTAEPPVTAWYIAVPTRQLWWRRLRAHLSWRSVYLQNALRLSLGLAVARAVAGVFDLSHGLWVLLATLTLMRTSLVASRAALSSAFVGTLVGAVLAGGLLAGVGDHDLVYAAALPVVMGIALAAGPLLGPLVGQAAFTVLVSVLFAQVASVTWQLAGVRLLDVVVGGLVGTVIGAAVWPRGGAVEVRRVAAACLREDATTVIGTVQALCGGVVPLPSERLTTLFDATYGQYRSEPAGQAPTHDWIVVLGVVHRVLTDAETLRSLYPDAAPLPWPAVTRRLCEEGTAVAAGYRTVADHLASSGSGGSDGARISSSLRADLDIAPPEADFAADSVAALRALDLWGWLHALLTDLGRVESATAGRRAPVLGQVQTSR